MAMVSTNELVVVGTGLHRPESVLATASGVLFTSDSRGGVLEIRPDGSQHLSCESTLHPNGIALLKEGGFLVANLADEGGVWRIGVGGEVTPWLMELEGSPVGKVNFVMIDLQGRTWVTISSSTTGWDKYPVHNPTGRILMDDGKGMRVVAEGLNFTNECRVSTDGTQLYVNETFGRRLSRFGILPSGQLTARETVATFNAPGDIPDGVTLDAEGGAWVVCVGSNRIYRVLPSGEPVLILDDSDPAIVAKLESAFQDGTLDRPLLFSTRGQRLLNITSIAFGGPDLRTAYIGSLGATSLVSFKSPVAGQVPVHWHWR